MLSGKFHERRYHPLKAADSYSFSKHFKMRKVELPTHPIMAGVKSFDGGSYSGHMSGALQHPTAKVVARWNNECPLIVDSTGYVSSGTIVALNFCITSSTCMNIMWDVNTNGDLIVYNSLVYAASNNKWNSQKLRQKMLSMVLQQQGKSSQGSTKIDHSFCDCVIITSTGQF